MAQVTPYNHRKTSSAHTLYNIGSTLYKHRKNLSSVAKNLFSRKRKLGREHMKIKTAKGDSVSNNVQKLSQPIPSTEVVATVHPGPGGHVNHYISTKEASNFRKRDLSVANLTDILFPKVHRNIRAYGKYNTVSITRYGTYPNSTFDIAHADNPGHQISTSASYQFIGEFMHLPLINRNSWACTSVSYRQLAADALHYSTISTSLLSRPATTTTASVNQLNSDPTITQGGHLHTVVYSGGKTTHYFQNDSNVDVTLQLWEVRPKTFLMASETPLATLCRDKLENGWGHTQESQFNISPDNTVATPDVLWPGNPAFTLSKDDVACHVKFVWSKSKTVVLKSSEKLTYVMHHPSFKTMDSTFLRSKLNADTTDTATNDIDYAPFCTSWLVFRARSQVAFGSKAAAPAEPSVFGPYTGTDNLGIQTPPFELLHWQVEDHNSRPGIWTDGKVSLCTNAMREAVTADTFELYNPQTNAQVVETTI